MVRVVESEINEPRKPVQNLFGMVKLPGTSRDRQILYFGWDTANHPVFTKDGQLLTQRARAMRQGNALVPYPFTAESAQFTPQVFEFTEMAQPIDNIDRGTQFVDDELNISCTDKNGAIQFVTVKERQLLQAIMQGQTEWSIGGIKSYSILLPDPETEKLHILLFNPQGQPSNEFGYRTFLLKVFKTLVTIDRNQIPPDQKGYLNVLHKLLEDINRKEADKDNRLSGVEKIVGELGILEEAHEDAVEKIKYLTVEQFRYVLGKCQEIVERRFTQGKQE